MLTINMLSPFSLSVEILNIFGLSVVILSFVAPSVTLNAVYASCLAVTVRTCLKSVAMSIVIMLNVLAPNNFY